MTAVSRCLAALILLVPVSLAQAQQDNQMLELIQQLTRLESEVRQLRGEVERLNHVNSRLKNRQSDLFQNLDTRLRTLETGSAPGTGNTLPASNTITLQPAPAEPANPSTVIGTGTPTSPAVDAANASPSAGANPVVDATTSTVTNSAQSAANPANSTLAVSIDPAKEQAAYKAAFNLLKLGKYEQAITAYTEFLQSFPAGKYAGNAQYWLGEANYVTRQFPQAIVEFQKVVKNHPGSKKLPDAMLKIGYIHYELKDIETARLTLTELAEKHPGTTAARLAENRLQRMKLEGR